MVLTVMESWTIVLVVFVAVLIMSFLMFLPPAVLLMWRMKRMPEISLSGAV
ncbi:hypothetical protein FKM82_015324 [Ascaphus truei]